MPGIIFVLAMIHYRAYLIGFDGHFLKVVDIVTENDETASERARQLVDGHDVELWQQERRIALFKRNPE
jgi:hypothetical protein